MSAFCHAMEREARTHLFPAACPFPAHPFPNANRQVVRCRPVSLDGNYIDYDYDPRSAKLSEQERRGIGSRVTKVRS